ncbi:MAG: DUF2147 domain-containing protein [Pseudomonadota bacterium]
MRAWGLWSAIFLIFGPMLGAHAADLDVAGDWYTDDRSSIITIEDCGNGTPCGVVRWLSPEASASEAYDSNNRDRSLRDRPIVGMSLLSGFKTNEGGCWQKGSIYNPEDGRTYRARIELISNDALSVSGCLGPICKTLIWHRASEKNQQRVTDAQEHSEDMASL